MNKRISIVLKYALIAVIITDLGWVLTNNYIIEIELWKYILLEFVFVICEVFYILATREIT